MNSGPGTGTKLGTAPIGTPSGCVVSCVTAVACHEQRWHSLGLTTIGGSDEFESGLRHHRRPVRGLYDRPGRFGGLCLGADHNVLAAADRGTKEISTDKEQPLI